MTCWRRRLFSAKPDLKLICGALIVLAIIHGRVLVGAQAYYHDDIIAWHVPWHQYGSTQLRQGIVTPWCDLIDCGFPMWADGQTGCFYPPNLLRLAPIPATTLYGWLMMLHYALAMTGLYVLARSRGAGRLGAVTGALVFVLSGFMIAHLNHSNIVYAASFLPWMWYGIGEWQRSAGPGALAIVALCSAAALLASHPQIWLMTAVSGVVLAFADMSARSPRMPVILRVRDGLKSVAAPSLAIALGVAIAAVQVLPMMQLGLQSVRAEQSHAFITSYSLNGTYALMLALWSCAELKLWEYVGFMGLSTYVLIVATTFLTRDRRGVSVLWFMALFALFMGFSRYNPLYHLLWRIPLVGGFRCACRWLLVWSAAISLLTAQSITYTQGVPSLPGLSRRVAAMLSAMALLLVGVGVAAWVIPRRFPGALQVVLNWLKGPDGVEGWAGNWLSRAAPHAIVASLCLMAVVICLSRPQRGRMLKIWGSRILAIAIVSECFLFAWAYNPTAPRALVEGGTNLSTRVRGEGRVLSFMANIPARDHTQSSAFRRFTYWRDHLSPNLNMLTGVSLVDGYQPLRLQRFADLLEVIRLGQLAACAKRESGAAPMPPLVAAALGAKWLVTDLPRSHVPTGWQWIAADADVQTYRNPEYQGLAWIASSQAPPMSMPGAVTAACHGDRRLLDTAYFEGALEQSAQTAEHGRLGRVFGVRSDGRGMVASCSVRAPAVIVFASAWYPGVAATVDGQDVAAFMCNGAFCGVEVPAGDHRVALTHRASSVSAGALISALALLVLVALCSISVLWRERSTTTA